MMNAAEKSLYRLMIVTLAALAALGIARPGPAAAFQGFWAIQMQPARLITDFTLAGGAGGALLNAALMGALALGLVRFLGVRFSGPTLAAVFTIIGFSLFGKTPVNTLPIMLGVGLASRLVGKPFKAYTLFALFGTALGPVVSFLLAETGMTGWPRVGLGLAGGVAAGFILPALAMAMLRMHEGYNLYNIGLTAGFFSLFAAAVFQAFGLNVTLRLDWNTSRMIELRLLIPLISSLFVGWGVFMEPRAVVGNLLKINRLTGRLPSDFMAMASVGSSLVNMGLLGLIASGYLWAVGADFNGPTLGGVFTLMGFGAFGKHPRNCWPIAAGVALATLLFGKSLIAPGPVLAILFATTLAPLAGEFGPWVGIAAGMTHLALVEQCGAWHGGLDLYNNGFSGGLTATLYVAVIQWWRANRS